MEEILSLHVLVCFESNGKLVDFEGALVSPGQLRPFRVNTLLDDEILNEVDLVALRLCFCITTFLLLGDSK